MKQSLFVLSVFSLVFFTVANNDGHNIIPEAWAKEINYGVLNFESLQKLAESGDAIAQFELAEIYRKGIDVSKNYKSALKWYLKSAHQGHLKAQTSLAFMFQNGLGTKKNEGEAFKWYLKAAKQGEGFAQKNVAYMYRNGVGIEENVKEATKWQKKWGENQKRIKDKKASIENRYESYHDIPSFLKIDGKTTMDKYMKEVLRELQNPFSRGGPRNFKYIDDKGNITRQGLENYKTLAKAEIVKQQNQIFVKKIPKNRDGVLSLDELAEGYGYEPEVTHALYNIIKKGPDKDYQKVKSILAPVFAKSKQKKVYGHYVTQDSIYGITRLFYLLDIDKNQSLSSKEIEIPPKKQLEKETFEVIANFESYLSLSKDGNTTTLGQVNEVAVKAFRTVDLNIDGKISHSEYLTYSRAKLPQNGRKTTCGVPSLKNVEGHVYAIGVQSTGIKSSVRFHGSFSEFTGYVEVHIDKQKNPINLLLTSGEVVWGFKGDVSAINKVIIFGSPARKGIHEINAGVIGIPKEKVIFSSSKHCWQSIRRHRNDTVKQKKQIIEKERGDIKYLTGRYPDLIRVVTRASVVFIKSSPEIEVFEQLDSNLKNKPSGFNQNYWDKFLEWTPSGYKRLDFNNVIFGAKAEKVQIYPDWAGLAQLEKNGVISPIKIDHKKRRAVFLLKKDLPEFPGIRNFNPTTVSLIANTDKIKFPNPLNNRKAESFCIMTRSGKILHGKIHCLPEDLALLKVKNDNIPILKEPVFLKILPYIPIMPAFKDSINIGFDLDEENCKKYYKEAYKEKCKIPHKYLKKELPSYALAIKPLISGQISWKNENTLTFVPEEVWRAGDYYTLKIDFDNMGLPEGVFLNGKRKAETRFYASIVSVQATNIRISDDPKDSNLRKLVADITSNYPLQNVDLLAFDVPEELVTPDEHFMGVEGYKFIYTESPPGVMEFEMPDMKRTMEKVMPKGQPNGTDPTHILLRDPVSAFPSGNPHSRLVWIPLKAPANEKLSDEINQLTEKAEQGNDEARIQLGTMYLEGRKIPRSLTMARTWLTKAAKQENIESYVKLGDLNSMRFPYDTFETGLEAYVWYSKAAMKGNVEAWYKLGKLHSTQSSGFYDLNESLKWYLKAAEANNILALKALGNIYEKGAGVKTDYKKAIQYYETVAAKDDPEALALIARMYHLGLGVKQEPKKAYEYSKKSFFLAKREDLVVRDITSRIVSEILLNRYRDKEVNTTKGLLIANEIFETFPKDFVRMWIASELSEIRDATDFRYEIAKEILVRQKQLTPDLPEVKYAEAKITLSEGYSHKYNDVSQYGTEQLLKGINILSKLVEDEVLQKEVVTLLVSLHLSNHDPKSAEKLINYAQFSKYFTLKDIAIATAYYAEFIGDAMRANYLFVEVGDRIRAAKTSYIMSGHPDQLGALYKERADQHPKNAWYQEKYAMFLLIYKGDYEGAIKYGNKALKIKDYWTARHLTGMAYLVKASQFFIKEGMTEKVNKYIKYARLSGINKWYILDTCNRYCGDIKRLIKAYKEKNIEIDQPI